VDTMKKLDDWNFSDKMKNSTLQLINRQKSALNVSIKSLDKISKTAEMYDDRNCMVQTTLHNCTCEDFNYIGGYARKKFQPCMHIYRLAMELGLMNIEHIGHRTKMKMMTTEEKKQMEDNKLRSLEMDLSQWGGWNEKIHKNWQQKERQNRAYAMWKDKNIRIFNASAALIHEYRVTLKDCDCPDFRNRHLPCKHIYCLAALVNLKLPVSYEQFSAELASFKSSNQT